MPGGLLKSKPTWSNASGCSATSAFFVLGQVARFNQWGNSMSTTSDQFGAQAKEVAENLKEMGETARNAAQEKIGQVGDTATEYYEQARAKLNGVTCPCQQFLRERPLTSVLLAVGIGWLLGCFWKRR